jgi:aminocarboxymuconate-semialdehyde decarboxylase
VPLQSPQLAIRELERCIERTRPIRACRSVRTSTARATRTGISTRRNCSTFFEAAADLGAAILVHPWDMMGTDTMPKYWLPWLVGMPAEQSRAACCLVFGGVLERLPKLRVCLAHGGGSSRTPLAASSTDSTCGRISWRPTISRNPREYLKRLYFDSWVPTMPRCATCWRCGVDTVMLGTDYPFPLGEQVPGEGIERLALDEAQRARIYHGTALEWLGLPASRFA